MNLWKKISAKPNKSKHEGEKKHRFNQTRFVFYTIFNIVWSCEIMSVNKESVKKKNNTHQVGQGDFAIFLGHFGGDGTLTFHHHLFGVTVPGGLVGRYKCGQGVAVCLPCRATIPWDPTFTTHGVDAKCQGPGSLLIFRHLFFGRIGTLRTIFPQPFPVAMWHHQWAEMDIPKKEWRVVMFVKIG